MGREVIFWSSWMIVLLVSVFDTWLCCRYAEHLPLMEQNPAGNTLIALGGVPLLVAVKFLGTTLVMTVLPHVPYRLQVAVGMAICQLALLAYLLGA